MGGATADCNAFGPLLRPKRTIQAAIDAAIFINDVIIVLPGTYHESLTIGDRSITIASAAGPLSTIIDATGLRTRVVTAIDGTRSLPLTIEGFTITGGAAAFGAGLRVQNRPFTLRSCIVLDNASGAAAGGLRPELHAHHGRLPVPGQLRQPGRRGRHSRLPNRHDRLHV